MLACAYAHGCTTHTLSFDLVGSLQCMLVHVLGLQHNPYEAKGAAPTMTNLNRI